METYITKINFIEELLIEEKMQLAKEKISELKNTIIYDVALKNCEKSNSKREKLRSAKEFLKNSKIVNKERILFHKVYKVDETYQLCDGYTGIVLNNMIEGLELNNEKGQYFDCRNVIRDCNTTEYEEIKIDMLELEQKALAVKKLKDFIIPKMYQIHINNLYFNPLYLLRAIKILGTENVTAYAHRTYSKQPIYFKSEQGEAIVLPLTPPTE